MTITEKHIIGAYVLLIANKQNITWKDVLVAQRDSIQDEFDAIVWNCAKQLATSLAKGESVS